MNLVLDSSVVIAFLMQEQGADLVERYLTVRTHNLYMHALNLAEVYYNFARIGGSNSAESAIEDILQFGVQERDDLGPAFWRAVGNLKATHRRSA